MIIIEKARKEDASQIAALHKQGITGGFLSQQSDSFLTALYEYLIKNEILIVIKENNKVMGFVSATVTTSGLYKKFLIKNIPLLIKFTLKNICSFSFFKKSIETLLSPTKSSTGDTELPELLSIVVDLNSKGKGYGQLLTEALEKEFLLREIKEYKVLVGSELKANRFYLKNGFIQIKEIELHKGEKSFIYIKKLVGEKYE